MSNSSDINFKYFLYSGSRTLAIEYLAPNFLEMEHKITLASSLVVVEITISKVDMSSSINTPKSRAFAQTENTSNTFETFSITSSLLSITQIS